MSDSPMTDPTLLDSDDADLVPRDKLFEHHRRQLSAMLDGELPPDQAKFMLRRLQHDGELAACWERWQVCGDMLRGRHDLLLPADFSQRVTAAIAAGEMGGAERAADVATASATSASGTSSPRWLRWGGGALAASVALVAVMFARVPSAPGLVDPANEAAATQVTALVAAGSPQAGGTGVEMSPALATTVTEAQAPTMPVPDGQPDRSGATVAAAAVAFAAMPRRAERDRRSTRSQTQRAGARLRATDDVVPQLASASSGGAPALAATDGSALAGVAAASTLAASPDPFVALPVAPTRPWPRAILPGYAAGAFNASFGGGDAASFHPFEPTAAAPTQPVPPDADAATRGPR